MKYRLLLLFIAVSFTARAQNITGYIAFTLVDSLNLPVNQDDYEIKTFTLNNGNEISLPVKYDPASGLNFIKLSPDLFTSNMIVKVTQIETGKIITINISLQPKFKSPEQFKNLLIMRIPVSKDQMQIDMPVEEISWQFIPPVKKTINGVEIEFKDLTFMQNWFY